MSMEFTLKAVVAHLASWIVAGAGLGIGYHGLVQLLKFGGKLIPKKSAKTTEAPKA